MGMAAGPAEVIFHMNKIHQFTTMSAGTTSQYAALEALTSPVRDEEIDVMRREYDERRHRWWTDSGQWDLRWLSRRSILCVPFDQRDRAYLNGVLQKTFAGAEGGGDTGRCLWKLRRGIHPVFLCIFQGCDKEMSGKIAAFVAQFDLDLNA